MRHVFDALLPLLIVFAFIAAIALVVAARRDEEDDDGQSHD